MIVLSSNERTTNPRRPHTVYYTQRLNITTTLDGGVMTAETYGHTLQVPRPTSTKGSVIHWHYAADAARAARAAAYAADAARAADVIRERIPCPTLKSNPPKHPGMC